LQASWIRAAAEAPITSERMVAAFTSSLAQASAYQCNEKPPQTATEFEALKENATSVMIGR
jgi:hypothetical protein